VYLSVPEATTTAFPTGPAPIGFRAFTRGPLWWLLALVVPVATAVLTMRSLQYGCSAAIVILVVGLYLRDRRLGLAAAWLLWLIAPFLRRLLYLDEPIGSADPLALVPYIAIGAVILLEYQQVELSRRSRRMLLVIAGGYLIGLPTGLIAPDSAVFALFSYLTAAACFVIGYREADLNLPPSWIPVLRVVVPVLAIYGIRQYFLDLPQWDRTWLEVSGLKSAGAGESGRVRIWSTLNSPGSFALILGLTAVAFAGGRRLTPLRLGGVLLVLGALALTYVRSAWVGLVLAIFAIVLVTRFAALKQIAPIVLILVVLGPVVFGGSTGAALTDRIGTFGALNSDDSAQARTATPTALLPVAASSPLGIGLGRAGEASRLSSQGGFRNTDNGYLSLMFQVGPIGFLLVLSVAYIGVRTAWQNAWRAPTGTDVVTLGVLVFIVITMFAGDQLYGIGGMIFWAACGFAVRRQERARQSPVAA
jgi:putative inorganic carbon (HCO3(-)) transporter